MEWTSLVQWDGMEWTFVGITHVCPLLPMVQWDGIEWTLLGFPQCVHYFSHGGTVGWDGHLSDSGECPKNIRTIWDSHCTIGHLLAMLDMTVLCVQRVLSCGTIDKSHSAMKTGYIKKSVVSSIEITRHNITSEDKI